MRPRVLITDLRIGGTLYPLSQNWEERVLQLELKFSRRINFKSTSSASITSRDRVTVRYSYKLVERIRTESKLRSPARRQLLRIFWRNIYRFLVKAALPDGMESTVP